MFARKLISRRACRATRPLVLVYRELCVRLYVIFIALEIMESELTFYDDNFCKFPCALRVHRWRMRFRDQTAICDLTRKEKKKERKSKF